LPWSLALYLSTTSLPRYLATLLPPYYLPTSLPRYLPTSLLPLYLATSLPSYLPTTSLPRYLPGCATSRFVQSRLRCCIARTHAHARMRARARAHDWLAIERRKMTASDETAPDATAHVFLFVHVFLLVGAYISVCACLAVGASPSVCVHVSVGAYLCAINRLPPAETVGPNAVELSVDGIEWYSLGGWVMGVWGLGVGCVVCMHAACTQAHTREHGYRYARTHASHTRTQAHTHTRTHTRARAHTHNPRFM
jgi:hypothetical protein